MKLLRSTFSRDRRSRTGSAVSASMRMKTSASSGVTVVVALLFSLVVLAGCGKSGSSTGGGGSATTSVTSANNGGAVGHYSGGGEQGSVTISFDASSSAVTNLAGQVLLDCPGDQNPYNLTPWSVESSTDLGSDGSFTANQTVDASGSSSAEIEVQGKLDGSGHASGTMSYIEPGVCDSGAQPIGWTASIGGTDTSPTTSTPSRNSCSPQPCGTSGGVSLSVTGLDAYPTGDPTTLVEMTFAVTNGSSQELLVTDTVYKLQPGNGQSIDDEGTGGYGGTLADGHTCGDNAADLQPGANSNPLAVCFQVPSDQVSQPFKLIWAYGLGSGTVGGTIDLSSLTVQTQTLPAG